jgi:hypothetical protein
MHLVWLEGSAQEMKVSKLWMVLSEDESYLRERIRDVRKGLGWQQEHSPCHTASSGRRMKSKNETCFLKDASSLSFP